MHHATLATATSGTVTLEIGLFGTPCLVCYKIARFDYFILRYIVKLKLQFISLVNILLKEELFPEHYYYKLDAKQIALSLESLFQKKEYVEKRLQDLQGIIHNKEGFARTASKAIMDKLKPHR
jgi:lipid-A-disaccharide synthase